MKKSIFTLAILIAGSFAAQKTMAQDIKILKPIIIIPENFDPTDPSTWVRPTPPRKPGDGPTFKTLSNEDGGRKTVALTNSVQGEPIFGWK